MKYNLSLRGTINNGDRFFVKYTLKSKDFQHRHGATDRRGFQPIAAEKSGRLKESKDERETMKTED